MIERKTVQVNVRLEKEVLEWFKKYAVEKDRTLNWVLNRAACRYRDLLLTDRKRNKRTKGRS